MNRLANRLANRLRTRVAAGALALLSALAWPAAALAQETGERPEAPHSTEPSPAEPATAARIPEPIPPLDTERLRVAAPYIELRTGPGRGFPVFHVVARDEWIQLDFRHTDWWRVRAADGRLGWVWRPQLESTLTEAGVRKTFRDWLLEDYLHRRAELGASGGRFKGDPAIGFWGSWRMAETLVAEARFTQVQGVYSGTTLWSLSVQSDPWADQRFSPFFGVGLGRFHNVPHASLVDARSVNVNQAVVNLGARYHLTDRFVLRLDAHLHTAFLSDQHTGQYRAVSAGLGFFF